MLKRLHTRMSGASEKVRLDHFLMEWLPLACGQPMTKTGIRKIILSGVVFVNRRRCKNGTYPLYSGSFVEVYYDEDKINQNLPKKIADIRLSTNRILYEDDAIIVVDKPPGIPTQPTIDPTRANLFDLVRRLLAQRDKVESPYLGLHHRLDRDTSGLVLFTKQEQANKPVSELFSKHEIQKTYQCLAWRSPAGPGYQVHEHFVIENYLGKLSNTTGKISKFGSVPSGGDFAKTEFKVVEKFRDIVWLEARPLTGRTHQIRVHLSEHGLPILGDPLYFPSNILLASGAVRLMLHASQLQFLHPITQQRLVVSSNLPDDFMQMLGTLKA